MSTTETSKYFEDVKKYDPSASEAIVDKIASNLRLVLSNPDAAYVSATDPEELATVRKNYLKKKLELSHSDEELDAGISSVMDQLKGVNKKSRVTVYYLLAKHFDKLDIYS